MKYYSDFLVASTNFMKVYGSRKLFFLDVAMLLCGSVLMTWKIASFPLDTVHTILTELFTF